MNEPRFTPGPWTMIDDLAIIGDDGQFVARINWLNDHDMGNANLIAAAPDMYEALEIIAGQRKCLDNLMSNADIARAALAKARGES